MKQLSIVLVYVCHLYLVLASRLLVRSITSKRQGHHGLNATVSNGTQKDNNTGVVPPCGGKLGGMIYMGYNREYYTFQPCGWAKPRAILVTIHCLGCTPGHAWDPYLKDAERHGFIVIAPQGYNASFNAAPYCCGHAREIGIDDQGFIKSLVDLVDKGRGLPVFATGVSNGGYMASSLAVAFPGWLTGVASMAGHIYHGLYSGLHGTASIVLWDETDKQVPPTGCCRDASMPTCCCGISELGPPKCTSSEEIFFAWKRANGCKATEVAKNPLGVTGTCKTGVGCQYPVEFCTFRHWAHNEWIILPDPIEKKVFNFFLAQLK